MSLRANIFALIKYTGYKLNDVDTNKERKVIEIFKIIRNLTPFIISET